MAEPPIILVVDESPINRGVLYDILTSRGYRVLIAENGDAAIEITRLVPPKIVLLDTDLPGIDGFETCRQIKSQPQGKDIYVLFISTHNDNESRIESFKAGGEAYLPKPVIHDEIYRLVDTYLELGDYKQKANHQNNFQEQELIEMDAIIDMVAHDINNPLVGMLGFIEELAEEFNSASNSPQEWHECLSMLKTCSIEIDNVTKSLILLKNLRTKDPSEPEKISVSELIASVNHRYNDLEEMLPLQLAQDLKADSILSDPILLEELLLMIWQTFSNLNAEASDTLSLHIDSWQDEHGRIQLSMSANTREISEDELSKILEPMSGGKRQKIKDTNILTVCIQKLIEFLAINGWSEKTATGLRVHLSFESN